MPAGVSWAPPDPCPKLILFLEMRVAHLAAGSALLVCTDFTEKGKESSPCASVS